MEDKGYAYPDPAIRRRVMVVAIFSGICVLAVLLLLHSVVRPWLDHYFLALEELAKHDPAAAKRSLLNVIALMMALSGSAAIGFGIWIFYVGWQMARAEQWPRPGMKVYMRVKILSGKSARRRGKMLIGLGLILAILVPALGWKAYRDSSTLLDPPRPNNRLQPTAPGAAAEPSREGYNGAMQTRAVVLFLSLCLPVLSVGCAHELSHEQSLTQRSRRAEQLKAWQLSQGLKGYASLRKSFELDTALLGLINGFPNSLHVGLRTTNLGLPNAVWWWNPLDDEGNPIYDWDTFLRVYQEASKVLIKYRWMLEWRDASPGRLVELHVFGIGIGETPFNLDTFILPVWREAGFAGQPTYSLLLRRGDKEWAKLYLGTEETRALVTSVSQPEESPAHWLDGLEVYYHPRCTPDDKSSRYVLVQPTGHWEIHAVRKCEP